MVILDLDGSVCTKWASSNILWILLVTKNIASDELKGISIMNNKEDIIRAPSINSSKNEINYLKPSSETHNHTTEHRHEDHSRSGDKRKNKAEHRPFGRKKQKGMNKNRGPTFRVERENELCPKLIDRQKESDPGCSFVGCSFTHDLETYLEKKLPSLGEECYVFNTKGHCPRGLTCRFASKHVTDKGLNIINEDRQREWLLNPKLHTINSLKHEVQSQLRKRTYSFDKSEQVLSQWSKENRLKKKAEDSNSGKTESVIKDELDVKPELNGEVRSDSVVGSVFEDHINTLSKERKKIDWRGKLFLSPLTTVGNLPFRRICKEFGADVTCGEMAMAANILQGKPQEWALLKRHGSEDLFGVQVCGANANVMTRCAQLIQEQTNVDFIDINVGCPIDLIYQQGAGSGLLNKKKVLFSIVECMKSVMDIPLSVKTRTGVYTGKNVAHTLMRNLSDAGADLITIHGRSKEQRYTKLADWEYVEQCAKLASPTLVVGNGDILSYEDYEMAKEKSPSAASVMIGRGALIKPWIFTEIKERRHWDITSRERYEILQKFTNYGLEHWGSDTKGVESTRRFMLEWLSFLYRYVPVGLMENPPQKMNERPPKFEGRDDLEILMASPNCTDWIKISEMLLGPVPEGFQFLPKHKANSWT